MGEGLVKDVNMGKKTVYFLLLGLSWIFTCKGNVTEQVDTNVTVTETDITNSTDDGYPDNTTSTAEVLTFAPVICDWNITAINGNISIMWSGNDDPESYVEVTAAELSQEIVCTFKTVSRTAKFSKGFLKLQTCTNMQYEVTIKFGRCSPEETSKRIWTPPDPPLNIMINNVGNSSFNVSWEQPPGNGEILLYNVSVTDSEGNFKLESTENNTLSIEELKPYTTYSVQMVAKNVDFWGKFSDEKTVTTDVGVPHAPINLKPTEKTNTTVKLTWQAPTASTGPILWYIVEGSNSSGSGEAKTPSNNTQYTLEDLTPFVQYTLRVLGETTAGRGACSNEIQVLTDEGVPHAPTELRAPGKTNTTVKLEWQAPTPSTGPIRWYIVEWWNSSGKGEAKTPSNNTQYTLEHLTPFVQYKFRVLGETTAGRGAWSNETQVLTDAGVPYAPTKLTNTGKTNTTVKLEWQAPTPSTGPMEWYIIEWRNSSGKGEIITQTKDAQHTMEHLTPFVKYTFKVLGETAAGRGAWSKAIEVETDVGVPHAPTKLSPTGKTNTTVKLEWQAPTPSTGPIEWYIIEWRNSSGKGEIITKTKDAQHTMEHLTPFVMYTFKVLGETAAGRGAWSKAIEVETDVGVPHAPTKLSPTGKTNTTVKLEWQAPTPSTGPIEWYIIEWRNFSGKGEIITKTKDAQHTMEHLTPFVMYTFKVLGETAAGRGAWSKAIEVETDVGVPHAPTKLSPTGKTNTTVKLEWQAPTPSTGPIEWYIIEWRNSSGKGEIITQTKDAQHTMEHLTPFVMYTFKVLGETAAGRGAWSKAIEVETDVGVPHAPTKLSPTGKTNTTVKLEWQAPTPSTGPIEWFIIEWRNSSGEGEIITQTKDAQHTMEHLTPFVKYTFKVLGETAAGRGAWSKAIEVETDVGVPHAPTKLSPTGKTNTTVKLEWQAPTPSTGPIEWYIIEWRNSSGKGEIITQTKDAQHTMEHLTPFVMYTFKVLGETVAGRGAWSEATEVETDVGVPHAPTNLSDTGKTNTTVKLEWQAPTPSTGTIKWYIIEWRNSSVKAEIITQTKDTQHTIEHLTPFVKYTFKVLGETAAGRGEWSKGIEVETDVGVPHAPTNLNQSEVTNTSVLLTWMEPKPSTGDIKTYTVRWTSSRNSGSENTKSPDLRYNVTGLFPYVNYTFDVVASTAAGEGQWSKSVKIETNIGVPTAARNLQQEHTTNVSIFLRWDQPEFPNAPVLNYKVVWEIFSEKDKVESHITRDYPSDVGRIQYVIPDLLPYTNYSIQVFATTSIGQGPGTNVLTVQTNIGFPLPAVILNVKPLPGRTALVNWKTEGVYPGPVEFSLQAWKYPDICSERTLDDFAKELKGNRTAIEWRREYETKVGGLTPFGNYSFLIVLKTPAIDGVGSKRSVSIRIAPEAPTEPLEVVADCINSPTKLRVSWKPPEIHNGIIDYYIIKYGIENENMIEKVKVKNVCESQRYILTGLRPERRYQISVRARVKDVAEDGKLAQPKKVCTLPAGIPYLDDTSRLSAKTGGPERLILEWTKQVFSDYMGEIVKYAVLVGRLESLGNATSGKVAMSEPPWFNFSSGTSDFYQATPPGWNPWNPLVNGPDSSLKCENFLEAEGQINRTVLRCFIGIQAICLENETYCNGPLHPETSYEIKIRAFTRGGYTETQPIYARSSSKPKPSVAGKVVAIVFTLFLLVGFACGGYILNKRGYLEPLRKRILSVVRSNTKEEPKIENTVVQMEQCVPSKPVKSKDFAEHVRTMMSDSHLLFSLEFEALKNTCPKLPCSIAETEDNRSKNRWMNIFPFDHSRVKLLPLCDEPGSDFINANYIPGYLSRREFIATQGPLPNTVDDFWRMLWEQSVTMIVMLTQCVERGKKKCEKYWPESGESQYYGDLRISNVSESMLSSFIIRIFHVQLGSYERTIKQMHFTHWPDFGCPECPEDLINFVNAVREHLPRTAPGPILVHCSAGVGRTGTFIAVDRLSRQLHSASDPGEDTIDVFGTILELRNYRTNMVQTEDQYIYIHLCVKQLIKDLNSPPGSTDEDIYSNVGRQRDTPM